MISIVVALVGAVFLCWTVREAWLLLLARPAQAQTSTGIVKNFIDQTDTQNIIKPHIAIDIDGLPIVVHGTGPTLSALRVAKCTSMDCTDKNYTNIDTGATAWNIVVSPSGVVYISYVKGGKLWLAQMASSSSAVTKLDTGSKAVFVSETQVLLGSSGNPIVVYHDAARDGSGVGTSENAIKIVRCTNATCSTSTPIEKLIEPGFTTAPDAYVKAVMDQSNTLNLLYHSYESSTTRFRVKFVRCTATGCPLTSAQLVGRTTSSEVRDIVIGVGGLPRLLIVALPAGSSAVSDRSTYLVNCSDNICSSSTEQVIVAAQSIATMTVDRRGYPVIALDQKIFGVDYLKLYRCATADCTGPIPTEDLVIQDVSRVDQISVAVLSDASPVVAYGVSVFENRGLSGSKIYEDIPFVRCTTDTCKAVSASIISTPDNLTAIAANGNVSGFSRSDGCAPWEDPAKCKGNSYYGWITMNCLNRVNNESALTDYCPGLDSNKRQLARVIICPLDDRGNRLNDLGHLSKYNGVNGVEGTALGLCIGRNQGDVVGYAYAGGVIQW